MGKSARKLSVSAAKKKAWEAFSKYIRVRDALKTTQTTTDVRCVTCGKVYPSFGHGCVQAGHFIAGRNNSILFEESGVHAQCYICNVVKKGATVEYFVFMEKQYGRQEIDRLRALSHEVRKLSPADLLEIAETYKKKYEELTK